MAWTTPRTWAASETVTASMMNQHVRDNLITVGTRVWTYSYITNFPVASIIIGRAPEDGTVTAIYAYRAGGTSCSIDGEIDGTDITSSAIATSDGSWVSGTVSAGSVVAGDSIAAAITAVSGTPTVVCLQIEIQLG